MPILTGAPSRVLDRQDAFINYQRQLAMQWASTVGGMMQHGPGQLGQLVSSGVSSGMDLGVRALLAQQQMENQRATEGTPETRARAQGDLWAQQQFGMPNMEALTRAVQGAGGMPQFQAQNDIAYQQAVQGAALEYANASAMDMTVPQYRQAVQAQQQAIQKWSDQTAIEALPDLSAHMQPYERERVNSLQKALFTLQDPNAPRNVFDDQTRAYAVEDTRTELANMARTAAARQQLRPPPPSEETLISNGLAIPSRNGRGVYLRTKDGVQFHEYKQEPGSGGVRMQDYSAALPPLPANATPSEIADHLAARNELWARDNLYYDQATGTLIGRDKDGKPIHLANSPQVELAKLRQNAIGDAIKASTNRDTGLFDPTAFNAAMQYIDRAFTPITGEPGPSGMASQTTVIPLSAVRALARQQAEAEIRVGGGRTDPPTEQEIQDIMPRTIQTLEAGGMIVAPEAKAWTPSAAPMTIQEAEDVVSKVKQGVKVPYERRQQAARVLEERMRAFQAAQTQNQLGALPGVGR